MQTATDYAALNSHANNPLNQIVAKAYVLYQKELESSQALDFDDLIMKTIELFEKDPETLEYYQNKFHYIHVDEYQDTNDAQYQLVTLLAAKYKNLCVVGDADQSIYGWRGANMNNILNFERDYPEAHTVMLEQNYRSTQTILKAANEVIANNLVRKERICGQKTVLATRFLIIGPKMNMMSPSLSSARFKLRLANMATTITILPFYTGPTPSHG